MIFQIDEIKIYFPFPQIYPEQHKYMVTLKNLIDTQGHCLIEMPSGTGKTISLLSLTVSYQLHMKQKGEPFKIVYCTRTVPEIEKTILELKNLIEYIKTEQNISYLGIGLASRTNLCINEKALNGNTNLICQRMNAEWSKNKCDFFDVPTYLPDGVFTLEDMREHGRIVGSCPYYLSRQLISHCDCIVYTYNYLIDPHIYDIVSRNIPKNSIIIFDEAHNIDNNCIEAMSFEITKSTTVKAARAVSKIESKLLAAKQEQENILKEEYLKMKKGELENGYDCIFYGDESIENEKPVEKKIIKKIIGLNEDKKNSVNLFKNEEKIQAKSISTKQNEVINKRRKVTHENGIKHCVPGNIRNSSHFLSVLKRVVEFYKTKLKTTHLTTENTASFINSISQLTFVDKKTLLFCSTRLATMLRTLTVDEDEEVVALKTICDASTIAAMHNDGFSVIFEPYDTYDPTKFNPRLFVQCLDSSIAIEKVFRFRNVIVTSGTLSPIEMYPKILNFIPKIVAELDASMDRNSICPLLVSKGNDQMTLTNNDLIEFSVFSGSKENENEEPNSLKRKTFNSDVEKINYKKGEFIFDRKVVQKAANSITTAFSLRSDPSIVRNYGSLVLELSKVVPDGMVVFFPSYTYMEQIVTIWSESFFITEIKKQKLIFIETGNLFETNLALKNYRKSVECGRGAILFCVARGKVSEGVDFEDGYGRCVIVLGVPYQHTESVRLKKRLEFLNCKFGISSCEFLRFDAMRHAGQCLGRVMRNKKDYGLMVLADKRFNANLLPKWIKNMVESGNINISVDMSVCIAVKFFREMAQTRIGSDCLLNADDLKSLK